MAAKKPHEKKGKAPLTEGKIRGVRKGETPSPVPPPPPAPQPQTEMTHENANKLAIIAALDGIKKSIMEGHISALGIIAVNTLGSQMGTTSLVYPPNLDPLQILGLTQAFQASCENFVFTPFNAPCTQVINA